MLNTHETQNAVLQDKEFSWTWQKVALLATVIIPLLFFIAKLILRRTTTYYIKEKLPESVSLRAVKIEARPPTTESIAAKEMTSIITSKQAIPALQPPSINALPLSAGVPSSKTTTAHTAIQTGKDEAKASALQMGKVLSAQERCFLGKLKGEKNIIKLERIFEELSAVKSEVMENPIIMLAAVGSLKRGYTLLGPGLCKDPEFLLEALSEKPYGETVVDVIDPGVLKDPCFVDKALLIDGTILKRLTLKEQDSSEIVKKAVSTSGAALEYASLRLRKDPAIALIALQNNLRAWRFIDPSLEEFPEIKEAYKKSAQREGKELTRVSNEIFHMEKEIVPEIFFLEQIDGVENFESLEGVFARLPVAEPKTRETPHIMLAAVGCNKKYCDLLGPGLCKDPDFILKALARCPSTEKVMDVIDRKLFEDLAFVNNALLIRGEIIQRLKPEWKKNPEFIKKALKTYGSALKYADPQLRQDPAMALMAIQNSRYGVAWKYVDPSIRDQPDIKRAYEQMNV